MQLTKIISLIAVASSGVWALPEPKPQTPVSVSAELNFMTDAATTVIVGARALSDSNVATIKSLVGVCISSAESDAAAAAASIAVIIGATEVYATAVLNIITKISACVTASG